ncbi:P-loop containing nucleoside triphosphate hydrolase protein [Xylariomycetidae sp. FL2044]|nr:P-loop containing nucleoside triphosphate hydrolase protein [Xylariomycetidae sp. FL2044]
MATTNSSTAAITMDDLKDALEYILTPSAPVFIVGGLIVLLVPILVHFFVVATTPYTTLPSVLLVGPPGAGKTSLLTLLERGDAAATTRTSQTPQSVELSAATTDVRGGAAAAAASKNTYREAARQDAGGSHKKFLLVDTPGHGKLRNHAMGQLISSTTTTTTAGGKSSSSAVGGKGSRQKNTVRGVVFVLDASTLDEGLAETAHYLYEVLLALQRRTGSGKTSRAPRSIPVLIAANKLDLFTALPASLVRSNLEGELGRIRQSRSKGLLDSGVGIDDVGSEEQDAWLGEYGSDKFAFGQMREFDIEVDVLGGSVLEGSVDKWWDWIAGQVQ